VITTMLHLFSYAKSFALHRLITANISSEMRSDKNFSRGVLSYYIQQLTLFDITGFEFSRALLFCWLFDSLYWRSVRWSYFSLCHRIYKSCMPLKNAVLFSIVLFFIWSTSYVSKNLFCL
jgi:hypothetical protein